MLPIKNFIMAKRGLKMFHLFNKSENGVFKYSHPLKVPYLKELCLRFDKVDELDSAFLYGSTLTMYCNQYSDIDLYCILSCTPTHSLTKHIRKFCHIRTQSVDLLFNTKTRFLEAAADISSLENRIVKEGVVLYAKSNAI